MEHDPPANRKRQSSVMLTIIVLLMFFAYPLSIGPVVWLYNNGYINDESVAGHVILLFYLPLQWLYQNTSFQILIDWYLQLFQ